MKRLFLFPGFIFIFLFVMLQSASADRILYTEEYYKLYHVHFYQYPDDSMENIFYLERALASDFSNPLYAIARVKDRTEYTRYTLLFKMHINLKIIEQYLIMGGKFDKFEVYFYNKEGPWNEAIRDSLKTAEWAYTTALYYWKQAKEWSDQAFALRRIYLPEIQAWADENFRIQTGDLDYERIINRQIARIRENLAYMGE